MLVFISGEFRKISSTCRDNPPQARIGIPVPETQSAFHPHAQRNAFRRRDTHQQRKTSELALRIVDHLRRRFARFELCAHLLQARRESFNLLLLLRGSHFAALTVQMPNLAE